MDKQNRKAIIAGNWKMNKTPTQTKAFMTELKGLLPKPLKRRLRPRFLRRGSSMSFSTIM